MSASVFGIFLARWRPTGGLCFLLLFGRVVVHVLMIYFPTPYVYSILSEFIFSSNPIFIEIGYYWHMVHLLKSKQILICKYKLYQFFLNFGYLTLFHIKGLYDVVLLLRQPRERIKVIVQAMGCLSVSIQYIWYRRYRQPIQRLRTLFKIWDVCRYRLYIVYIVDIDNQDRN